MTCGSMTTGHSSATQLAAICVERIIFEQIEQFVASDLQTASVKTP